MRSLEWDMVFADDERESNPATFKLLQMAHAWSQAKKAAGGTLTGTTTAPTPKRPVDDDATSDVASSHGSDD